MVAESTQETAIWRTSEAFIGPNAALLAASGRVWACLGLCEARRCVIMQSQDLARTTDEAGIETDWRQVG